VGELAMAAVEGMEALNVLVRGDPRVKLGDWEQEAAAAQ
jgi:hypothetical protein